jgi:hypothetical protein
MKRFILPFLLASTAALADPLISVSTIEQLSNGPAEQSSLAYGFLLGAVEAVNGSRICPPPGTGVWSIVKLVAVGLDQLPPGAPAARTVIQLLEKRYPC